MKIGHFLRLWSAIFPLFDSPMILFYMDWPNLPDSYPNPILSAKSIVACFQTGEIAPSLSPSLCFLCWWLGLLYGLDCSYSVAFRANTDWNTWRLCWFLGSDSTRTIYPGAYSCKGDGGHNLS